MKINAIFRWLVVSTLVLGLSVAALADGRTIYVSKLGDNSDGASWARAYTTIQAALSAVPDGGGHRLIVRPDTYFEAMLFPAHRGAPGRYNELVGDVDGRFGSGTTGSVAIDSGDPEQKGFKSYDWWGTIRSYAKGWSAEHKEDTFSAVGWDRWRMAGLYVTGGDAGIFFDLTDHVEPFSVVVEDCISIGRAFGGGVASCLSRPDEPITFRRCRLWALDFWGDTAGAYCRVENPAMPARPDVVFEDCVMVGPQCSLKAGNFGFHTFTRIKTTRCRLVTLNFSQPPGTPTDGVIQSVQEGKLLHVDLEDTTLMGYKVFGVIVKKETVGEIGYSVKGDVKAYVQFQQAVPAGIFRLGGWPVDVFQAILPDAPRRPSPYVGREKVQADLCEIAPFVWKGKQARLECQRPAAGGTAKDYYFLIRDSATGEELSRFAEGYSLGSIIVHDGAAYAFASRWEAAGWRDVTVFWSRDLKHWESKLAVPGDREGLFNTSVCRGPDGFVMAYESDDAAYPAFTIKFARSNDLLNWTKRPEATFGTDRYTACPCLRYVNGYYYVLYLEQRRPRWFFETYITRSRDLTHWELSPANPVLAPQGIDEGINASDPELEESGGKTYVYFAVGDQLAWASIKRAVFPGTLREFLESWYKTPGIPDRGTASGGAARRMR
jgi:hypothetical protein